MVRRTMWMILVVAAMALAGVGYQLLAERASTAGHVAQAADAEAEKVVTVEAASVTVGTVLDDIRAVGTLRANDAVVISPEIAGRISAFRFEEGNEVAAGDVLVELGSTILRAELVKARSDLKLAESNRERAMALARQGTGTLRSRDEAVAAHQVAEANLALAQARLEKATITAPISGVIGIRSVSEGAYVTPGTPIVEMVDIDPIKVDFRVPELVLSSVRVGQTIRLTVDALPGRTFEGSIYVVDPIVDANGRAVRLRALVDNPGRDLFPGLFARVQIVVERRENSVLIPESAVFAVGGKRFVYRIIDQRASLTEVELGQRQPGQVEIRAGLGDGDSVVTAGHQQVSEGVRVEVVRPTVGS